MRVVLATSNPAKIERLRWLLADVTGLELVLPERPLEIAEGTRSLCENAAAKARTYAVAYGMRSIATDGGLHVPALGEHWNAVTTGRNASQLLGLVRDLSPTERVAFQVECAAISDERGNDVATFEARSAPRQLADVFDPRGLPHGFWVPGLLLYGPGRKRYAELPAAERERLADDHWLALREQLTAVLRAEVSRQPA